MDEMPIIAVASGKGGVGKSSVAVALARGLTRAGLRIGLVDADIAGPDVPRMLGLRRDVSAKTVTLAGGAKLEAVEVEGFRVASAGFLMGGGQALALGGNLADLLLGRLIKDTRWGGVEALVVDLPPGVSFTQQGVLSGAGRVAAILVVTPAEVAHLDTGRALSALREVRTPVLGGVENMAYFACPCCGEKTELHAPAPADRTIWAAGVERLARLPFRPGAEITASDLDPVVKAATAHIAG